MAFDRFLIAPFDSGLVTNMRPWLIADDAYALLQNAYVFRGRVRKRFGSALMSNTGSTVTQNAQQSRLRIALTGGAGVGITDGAGNATGTVPGAIFKVGQAFSIGAANYTVNVTGAPATMLATVVTPTATYNTNTGVYNFVGAPAGTQIFFYPAEPVMNLSINENGPINNQPTYGFDTQFAYIFTAGAWARAGITPPTWHGTDTDFFWTTTFRFFGATTFLATNFFVVNPNGLVNANDDPIYILPAATDTWAAFTPKFFVAGAGSFIQTAKIMVSFKGRLVLLNTIERDAANANNKTFVNRARFSAVGNPFAATAFLEVNQVGYEGGGFIDAPTAEAIITCEFIKDRLIVYFERSVYELAWTGNDVVPFVWNKLDNELGSESTFSVIPFNLECLAIASNGIHSCNGSNVNRIDQKIPDKIWTIKNKDNAPERVVGIRDYWVETVYWAYPSSDQISVNKYPNRVLVYNYQNKTWAENDDTITFFGYFEQGSALTWASSAPLSWSDITDSWNSGYVQAQTRQVVAGNQEGFTFVIFPELTVNAPVMQLTNATLTGTTVTLKIVDHNLQPSSAPDNGDYIYISNASGATNLNGNIYPINGVTDKDTVTIIVPTGFTLPATYTGGGLVSRVSNIKIKSKQWNPYDKQGQNVYLARIDFAVRKTSNSNPNVPLTGGQITVDYYPSASEFSMVQGGQATMAAVGTSVLETTPYDPDLYPFEQYQARLWHPVYFQSTGECIQLYMYFNDSQMRTLPVVNAQFEIEGMVLHTKADSARLQ